MEYPIKQFVGGGIAFFPPFFEYQYIKKLLVKSINELLIFKNMSQIFSREIRFKSVTTFIQILR